MSNIYCSVNNCYYWKKGNVCNANQIMITSDDMGDFAPDSLDALDHNKFEETPVETCMETCCKTFVDKGYEDEKDDGIMKM